MLPGSAEVLAATGNPAAAIVDHVRRHGAPMVCMATRDRSPLGEVLGSISAEVVRSSPAPVLLVGPRVESFGPRVERIVACLDGSEAAARALPVAADLAAQIAAELVRLRVAASDEAATFRAPVQVEVVYDDSPARALRPLWRRPGRHHHRHATRGGGAIRRLVLGR